jgi:hypothetical protein
VSLLELGELGHYLTPIEHIALQFVLATEMVNATLLGQLRFERFERMASATLRLYDSTTLLSRPSDDKLFKRMVDTPAENDSSPNLYWPRL